MILSKHQQAQKVISKELVKPDTPWEVHYIQGTPIFVKREDLCCPHPGPSFSKIRGLAAWIDTLPDGVPVGVLDTFHSKGGWGIAYLCHAVGRECYDFYPQYKSDNGAIRPQQRMAYDFGAELIPLQAGRSAILYHQAKKMLAQFTDGIGIMVPNALKVKQSVDETAAEVLNYTPDELFDGTWVVSISSGTIAAGVLKALASVNYFTNFVAHMGYSRSWDAATSYIIHNAGLEPLWWRDNNFKLIDEGYEYKDWVENTAPFPCNPYYDAKAWKWLECHFRELKEPIIFWSIGE